MANTNVITFYSVKQTVAAIVSQINPVNRNDFSYFEAMAVAYDLHKAYPTVTFPEDNFNKYCKKRSLCRYIYNELKTHQM